MTELVWLACTDPGPMLEFLRSKASERKLRLFACACCRRIWHLLTDVRSLQAVEVAERYADGEAGLGALTAAGQAASSVTLDAWGHAAAAAEFAAEATWSDDEFGGAYRAALSASSASLARGQTDSTVQCDPLRDLTGPLPFRAARIGPTWLTWSAGALVKLAQTTYDDRLLPAGTLAPARLAILADALEEAGCTDLDILNHCRQPGVHVRGCWVVDLLLGKS
jgi:hypothetical protein